jgi:hypothetical protein
MHSSLLKITVALNSVPFVLETVDLWVLTLISETFRCSVSVLLAKIFFLLDAL